MILELRKWSFLAAAVKISKIVNKGKSTINEVVESFRSGENR